VNHRVRYGEGDWFAVPLRDGGFGVGILARANRKGVLLGYFFGPRRGQIPELPDVTPLRASDAVLVAKFGHLGIRDGRWPLLGVLDGWNREDWPMPIFGRYEELSERNFQVFYEDDDPNVLLKEKEVSAAEISRLPENGLYGDVALAITLNQLI
jgi:Immunity protein 26